MLMLSQALSQEPEISQAVRVTMGIAQNHGFATLDQNLIGTALSEMLTNALRYAGSGILTVHSLKGNTGLEFRIEDQGPGMRNLPRTMEDGHSTVRTSLGIGLGAAKRAMDYFRVYSKLGIGTRVVMRKYLPRPDRVLEYGVMSIPDVHHVINGDAYVIKEFEGNKV